VIYRDILKFRLRVKPIRPSASICECGNLFQISPGFCPAVDIYESLMEVIKKSSFREQMANNLDLNEIVPRKGVVNNIGKEMPSTAINKNVTWKKIDKTEKDLLGRVNVTWIKQKLLLS
jgi:hypothetical protein